MKNPKCPVCGSAMKEIRKDESSDSKNGKKYSRTVYHCDMDDVWVSVEIPKTE